MVRYCAPGDLSPEPLVIRTLRRTEPVLHACPETEVVITLGTDQLSSASTTCALIFASWSVCPMAQSQPSMIPTNALPNRSHVCLSERQADAVEEVLEVEGIISLPYDTWGS